MENYKGATRKFMERSVEVAKDAGLVNVSWSGQVGFPGRIPKTRSSCYEMGGGKIAGGLASEAGCNNHPRNCGTCSLFQKCPVKNYEAAS